MGGGKPRWANSAVAVGEVRVLVIEFDVFRALVDWWPDFLKQMQSRRKHMYEHGFDLALFAELSSSARSMVMGALKAMPVHKGEIIVKQTVSNGRPYICDFTTSKDDGTVARSRPPGMYFVSEGSLSVLMEKKKVATLTKGQFFGEQNLLATNNEHRTATVVATTDGTLYQLEKKTFDSICEWHPEVAQSISRSVSAHCSMLVAPRVRLDTRLLGSWPLACLFHSVPHSLCVCVCQSLQPTF